MSKKLSEDQHRESVDEHTLVAIDDGLELAENGKRWTMEEAFEFARNRRKQWMTEPSDQRPA